MSLQAVSTTQIPVAIPALQQTRYQPMAMHSPISIMLLQLLSQLNALDLAYNSVHQKCEAAAKSLEAERKRRARERERCDKIEETLLAELLDLKKLAYAASQDKQWLEMLMTELEKRHNETQARWQEELDTCKKNDVNLVEQLRVLEGKEQRITKQLEDCNTKLQGISQCSAEKQSLLEERNGMAEALQYLDNSVKNQMLLKAARNGRGTIVKMLIINGADMNVKDSPNNYRRTPLHWGATEGHVEVMKVLIELGADPRSDVDSDIYNLLHSAARYGKPNAVRYILDGKWVPLDALTPGRKETALHLASRHGHTEVINILLAAGANIDAQNIKGSTPLHMAAWNGRKTAAITLVNHGASLTVSDNDGNAYENARSQGHYDIAQFIKSRM